MTNLINLMIISLSQMMIDQYHQILNLFYLNLYLIYPRKTLRQFIDPAT